MLQGNGAVVVAHPDDETLWAGGFIANNPGVTVICCTVPRRDPERALKFFDAVRVLGGFPVLVPFVEPPPTEDIEHLDVLELSGFDWVVTHNSHGEYGHRHHRNVHQWVMANSDCPVWTFGYGEKRDQGVWTYLDGELGERKKAALMCYDHKSSADGGKPKWEALMDTYDIDPHMEVIYVER